ncbi:unnamed protein product [Dicrocoelium dendriticum]|nr:unnamed protein product [Dicrocoelium dendriticum]
MNSLLPKRSEAFAKKEYWDRFFASRKSFEWYGDFLQHSAFFAKYVKSSDNVLIIGCGNSELGFMLNDRIKCASVFNIDTSETVVMEMNKKHGNSVRNGGLRYECLDVLHLSTYMQSTNMNPFTCIVDKGTLDAIHSGEDSELTVLTMFENLQSSLKLMGRYILLTLAQEHIVESICNFFLLRSNEWLINCHQLTCNRCEALSPSPDLPRIFVYPFGSSEPLTLATQSDCSTLKRQLTSWIVQEQNRCLLWRDLSCGSKTTFRFLCPKTGLTVFHCEIVDSKLKKTKQSKRQVANPKPVIEAVFLVPFGHNRSSLFCCESKRASLCSRLNLRCILLAYFNPRFYCPDLDSMKEQLCEVFTCMGFSGSIEKSPILCTPDGFVRREVFSPVPLGVRTGLLVDEIEVHSMEDNRGVCLMKRLVDTASDFRPVVTTAISETGFLHSLSSRDLHLSLWTKLIQTECTHESKLLHCGFPLLTPDDSSVHFVIPALDLGDVRYSEVYLDKCYAFEDQPSSGFHVSWLPSLSELSDDTFDAIFYDPVPFLLSDYLRSFSTEQLQTLSNVCNTHLLHHGFLIVVIDDIAASVHTDLIVSGISELQCVASYTIPDEMMSDPPTLIHVFQRSSLPANQLRQKLTERVRQFQHTERPPPTEESLINICKELITILSQCLAAYSKIRLFA